MKRVIDEETRQTLINVGVMPFNSGATHEYCPIADNSKIPEELRPKYTVRSFTKPERVQAFELYRKIREWKSADIAAAHEMTKKCVSGWRDVVDLATDEDVPFDAESWDALPQAAKTDLFAYLCRISGLTDTWIVGLKF